MSSLSQFPFDILYQVAGQLDVVSYDSLSKASRSLHDCLRDEHTARISVHASVLFSPWSQLALSANKGSFRTTIDRVSLCNNAFQTASPYSASVLGHATSFSYHGGIVCYTTSSHLRILDFNHRPTSEKVFAHAFFRNFLASSKQGAVKVELETFRTLQLKGCADNVAILTCHLGIYGLHLFAVNISEDFYESSPGTTNIRRSRIVLSTPLISNKKLFVRHNSRYIIWGTHSAAGNEGHHEWLLYRHDLATPNVVSKEPLQLSGFSGGEVGSTACFTIFEDHFYAVTNQASFETEEVDWTSYYHVVKFRLDSENPDVVPRMVWRRQHLEGPINDAWTDLGFQIDHRTGELLIVECRKEWVDGGSRCVRTYYSQPMKRAVLLDAEAIPRAPPDDPLRRTLDEKNNSHYEDSHVRIERYMHSEYAKYGAGEDARDRKKEYIRAKTKWNGYDFNRQCFVDLVSDDVTDEGSWRPRERLRLRIVSRKEISPLVLDQEAYVHGTENEDLTTGQRQNGDLKYRVRPRVKGKDGVALTDGEEKFTSSEIVLWPSDAMEVPRGLDDVLCPGGKAGDVTAVLGYEGIVYLAGPADWTKGGERALVFVCFDPTFGFDGMKRVDGSVAVPRARGGDDVAGGREQEARGSKERDKKKRRTSESVVSSAAILDGDTGGDVKERMTAHGLVQRTNKRIKSEEGGTVHETEAEVATAHKTTVTEADADAGLRRSDLSPYQSAPRVTTTTTTAAATCPTPLGGLGAGPSSTTSAPSARTPDASRDDKASVNSVKTTKPKVSSTAGRSTWREKAAHVSIGKGFWLR
ncbi:hypothetical protein PV08_06672 [Exophiala spinifera]|uniref:F-box domain-containing protein n=1 Tax=Exophiala spinifera TaxID=91928 RepID=A0A0D1YFR4_9EURO|nr:uncharacterized protein PV08_06672 [Exophiala spinifera]KIW13891.1 hypothetical protein PV08_06672 [Exophiala spinifera]